MVMGLNQLNWQYSMLTHKNVLRITFLCNKSKKCPHKDGPVRKF